MNTTLTELNRVLDALMLELDGADEVHASKLVAFFDRVYAKARQAKKLAEEARGTQPATSSNARWSRVAEGR